MFEDLRPSFGQLLRSRRRWGGQRRASVLGQRELVGAGAARVSGVRQLLHSSPGSIAFAQPSLRIPSSPAHLSCSGVIAALLAAAGRLGAQEAEAAAALWAAAGEGGGGGPPLQALLTLDTTTQLGSGGRCALWVGAAHVW